MSQPNARQTLRRRALGAMINEALFDWKGAVVVALTILLAAFGDKIVSGSLPWHWIAGGLAAWGLLFASMLTDPAFGARVVAQMLRRDYDPARLRNPESQARINKALEYRRCIAEAGARAREGLLRDHLSDTAGQIDAWIENMYQLATRLDVYESDGVIRQDLKTVPQAIEALQKRLKAEDDEAVREQIQQTLQARQQQWASLKTLDNTMEKAELQMDSTVTALGTVYSQLLLVSSKDIDSGRAQRLRQDINDQVTALHDLVASVDQVYAQRT